MSQPAAQGCETRRRNPPPAVLKWISSNLWLLVVGVAWIARNLPAIGALMAVAAAACALMAAKFDSFGDGDPSGPHSTSVLEWIHHVGRVVTLNGDFPDRTSVALWTAAAQALATIAAGILGLEIFRFLAGNVYDWVRMRVRRRISWLLGQQRVMVVGEGAECAWMARGIAGVAHSGGWLPLSAYQVTLLRRDAEPEGAAADLGPLMAVKREHLDAAALASAGLAYADQVILMADTDARTLELLSVALSIKDRRIGRRRRSPRVVRVRLDSPGVADRVRQVAWDEGGDEQASGELRVWVPDELAARAALRRCRIDWRHSFGVPGGETELVCIGFGVSNRTFAMAALRQIHHVDEVPVRLTIVDPDADTAVAALRATYPAIDQVAHVTALSLHAGHPDVRALLAERAADPARNLCVAVSVGDIDRNLEIALGLPGALRAVADGGLSPPVFVRQSRITESGRVFHRFARFGHAGGLAVHPWGGLEDAFAPGIVLEGALDRRAKRVHGAYLRKYPPRPEDAGDPLSSRRPWEQLGAFKQDDNRNSADFLEVRLRAVGLRLAGATGVGTLPDASVVRAVDLGDHEREVMSRLEHRRWVVMRLLAGWTLGPRDDRRRIHPSIVPWAELSAAERAKDDIVSSIEESLFPDEWVARIET